MSPTVASTRVPLRSLGLGVATAFLLSTINCTGGHSDEDPRCTLKKYLPGRFDPLRISSLGYEYGTTAQAAAGFCTTQKLGLLPYMTFIFAFSRVNYRCFFKLLYLYSSSGSTVNHTRYHRCRCTDAQYVRRFRRAMLETLRVLTGSVSGYDTAHSYCEYWQYCHFSILTIYCEYTRSIFGFCTFMLPELPSVSGFDTTAGTAGARSNWGGYCQYWQYSGVIFVLRICYCICIGSNLVGRY